MRWLIMAAPMALRGSAPPRSPSLASPLFFRRASLAVGALVLSAGVSCRGCGGPTGPNVLLITVDSLRTDHVHALGYARETTPTLDGLAREGVTWTGVVSAAPWTTPSMMSLMTGLHPEVHHVDTDDRALASSVRTLAQRVHDAGYSTATVG